MGEKVRRGGGLESLPMTCGSVFRSIVARLDAVGKIETKRGATSEYAPAMVLGASFASCANSHLHDPLATVVNFVSLLGFLQQAIPAIPAIWPDWQQHIFSPGFDHFEQAACFDPIEQPTITARAGNP